MTHSRCLCGAVTWKTDGPFQFMSHCHCSRCRKAHGTPFATYVAAPAGGFRSSGRERVGRWESSPGFFRYFCTRCGSVVPGDPWQGLVFLPAGCMEEDPGERPGAHIFVASRAPWFEIRDALPRFEAYPPTCRRSRTGHRPIPLDRRRAEAVSAAASRTWSRDSRSVPGTVTARAAARRAVRRTPRIS